MGDAPTILNEACRPPKSKDWSCRGCHFFQYSPTFTSRDREVYQATLDAGRRERKNHSYCIEPIGSDSAKVMALLESPGSDADQEGVPSGGHLSMIRRYARTAEMDPDAWRVGYVLRCHPPDKAPQFQAVVYCTRFLVQEILRVRPATIITFGVLPTQVVLGKPQASILEFHGIPQNAVVAGHPCTVYPLWAPGYVQRNDYLAPRYIDAFYALASFLSGKTGVKEDLSAYGIIRNVDDAIDLCRQMMGAEVIDLDLETSGLNPYENGSRICIVSLATSLKAGYAIPYNHDDNPWTDAQRRRFVKEAFRPLLCRPGVRLRLHNGKFDYKWIRQHMGFWPADISEDTMTTAYAVDERESHGLKYLAMRYTDMGDYDHPLDAALKKSRDPVDGRPRYDLVPLETIGRYAAQDPVATRKVARAMRPLAREQGAKIEALAYRMLPALVSGLTRMEHNGVEIDQEFAKRTVLPHLEAEHKRSWDVLVANPTVHRFIREHEAAARAKLKRPQPIEQKKYFEFSLNSPKQLAELIYEPKYFGEECHLYTDSGKPSTDKEVLEELAKAGSPIARLIQECRLDERMISTFVGPMMAWLEKQGDLCLHCDFLPHGTKTGRLSCRSPNLQQIPNKSKGLIKRLFVSRYGEDGVFIQVDFSQIELRILAAVTGDERMLRVYRDGGDIHAMNACMIFKLTPEEFAALDKDTKKKYRTIAKRVGFGIAYGIGADGIQSTLRSEGVEVTLEEAQRYLDSFFESYPKSVEWIEKVQTETGIASYSRSLFGRRRRLEEIKSYVSGVRAGAERQAINHVIQSTAADVTNTALILFDQEVCIRQGADPELLYPTVERRDFSVDRRWERVHPILQVHDMLGVDAHREVAGEALERLVWTMEHSVELSPLVWGDVIAKGLRPLNAVPIVADPEVGPNWRDAYKAKDRGEIDKAMHVSRAKRTFFDGNLLGDWTPELEKAALDAYGAKGGK